MSNANIELLRLAGRVHLKGSTTWADPDGWMIPTCR
jgi:hypothetical protein